MAWRAVARDRSASTSRLPSSRPPGRCSASSGIEFPLIEANAAENGPARRLRSTSSSPSTAPRSGAIPTVDPGGGASAAAGRRARLSPQLDALDALPPTRDGRQASSSSRPQFGLHRLDWWDEHVEFHLAHGDWFRAAARATASRSSTSSSSRRHRTPEGRRLLRLRHRRVGARSGLRRRSGRLASGELARRPAPPAGVDQPAAAPDPRPARDSVRRSRADLRGGGPAEGQRSPARARARARQGSLGRRAGRRAAGARRRHRRLARREDLRQAGERGRRPSGCSRSSPARRTSWSPASA